MTATWGHGVDDAEMLDALSGVWGRRAGDLHRIRLQMVFGDDAEMLRYLLDAGLRATMPEIEQAERYEAADDAD